MRLDTIAKLIAMLLLQVKNLPTFQTEVGATAADITEVTNDLANLEYLDDQSGIVDADKRTLTQIKQAVYNGDPDDSVADFPVFPVLTAPQPLVAGALPRAQERNRRFKAATGYTPEIGVALGIEGESKEAVDLNTFTPHADLFAAQSGYLFSCVVTNRGESDMWEVLVPAAGREHLDVPRKRDGQVRRLHVRTPRRRSRPPRPPKRPHPAQKEEPKLRPTVRYHPTHG